jgi:hypothetical protein
MMTGPLIGTATASEWIREPHRFSLWAIGLISNKSNVEFSLGYRLDCPGLEFH